MIIISWISCLCTGTNVCKDNNGGCQQLCLYRGNGQRTCACAHGMLAEDGSSCRDYDGYLLYSERTILKSVHLSDENNLNAPIKPFEDPEHMKNVIALTFDYRGGGGKGANRIFFSDIHFGNIQQISDDGSDRKTVVESKYSYIFSLSAFWPPDSLFPGLSTVYCHKSRVTSDFLVRNLGEENSWSSQKNTPSGLTQPVSFYSECVAKLETKIERF